MTTATDRVQAVSEKGRDGQPDEIRVDMEVLRTESVLPTGPFALQTATNPRRESVRRGIAKKASGHGSKYWLGTLLVCGECGSNYQNAGLSARLPRPGAAGNRRTGEAGSGGRR